MLDLLERTVYMPGHEPITTQDYVPTAEDYKHMGRAVELGKAALAKGTTPVGTVLVEERTGETWEACNTEFSEDDLMGHPEMLAYRQAQPSIGRDLSTSAMYTVAEPCIACSYIIDKGNLGTLYVGAFRAEVDFFRPREITMDPIFKDSRRSFTVVRGLMNKEALELLRPENNIHHRFS